MTDPTASPEAQTIIQAMWMECVPSGCQCDCHKPGMSVSHVVACCVPSTPSDKS